MIDTTELDKEKKIEAFLKDPDAAPRKKPNTTVAYVCQYHTNVLATPYEVTDKGGKKVLGLACPKCRMNFTPGVTEVNRFIEVNVKEFVQS